MSRTAPRPAATRVMLVGLLLASLAGCVSGPGTLYAWNGYDDKLNKAYKSPDKAAEARTELEEGVRRAEANGQKVPPGVLADIGTLYLQAGNRNQALAYYSRERSAWPESRLLMDALIRRLQNMGDAPGNPAEGSTKP